jgi:hypothetical protein
MPRRKHTQSTENTLPVKRKRGRPPKVKPVETPEPLKELKKRPRGRPPKGKPAELPDKSKESKRGRGRPSKAKPANPRSKIKKADSTQLKVKPPVDAGKTPQERIIEQHVFYPAALWIEKHIETAEEAYLRKTAKRHGLTMLQTILDHMLGYFSIRDSELGKALKDSKKHTHNNELQN